MKKKLMCICYIMGLALAMLTACGETGTSEMTDSLSPEYKASETAGLQASESQTYGINRTSMNNNSTDSEYEISDMLPRPSDDTLIMSVEEAEAFMKNRAHTNTDEDKNAEEQAENRNTSLVVYFSRAENIDFDSDVDAVTSASINVDETGNPIGNMRLLAEYISEETGADIFSIQTVETYPTGYKDTTELATEEKNDNARPALSTHVDNMDDYNVIYLGYPNWWGTLQMPVASFLEEYDFAGKTIIPYVSYEGSGMGSGVSMIKELCPDAEVLDGFAIRGGEVNSEKARQTVAEFIAGL